MRGVGMTKTEFLNYARNEMQGWCYVWIERDGDIGLHELYPIDGALTWTENPIRLIEEWGTLHQVLQEITQMFEDGLIFTEQELSSNPS